MKFNILYRNKKAKIGQIQIEDKYIETPIFMPVGTFGVVKSISSEDLENIGFKIILSNTLHLINKPGKKTINIHKNIQKFMNWNNLILTDSGGFQHFSLNGKTTDNGILFNSVINNKPFLLTPKNCIKMQESINSNIIMVLDECTKYPINIKKAYNSLKISMKWAKECKINLTEKKAIFGIIQGSIYPELRKISIKELKKINFDGYAIGGLSVGESKKEFLNTLDTISDNLPNDKPIYLMGIGYPQDILEAVLRGIDMFDCVIPTRNARNGQLFTSKGILKINKIKNKYNTEKIDYNCNCYTCSKYTISYIYHLNKINETLGIRLNTIHNLTYYKNLITNIKKAIIDNKINEFKNEFYKFYKEEKNENNNFYNASY